MTGRAVIDDLLRRVQRRTGKIRRSTQSLIESPWLERSVRRKNGSLVDRTGGTVVSLTSYGARLRTVHLTVESIGRGRVLPRRLILWTDPGVKVADLSKELRSQMARGLEVRESPGNFGPHTKYFPYAISSDRHSFRLVTADDDTLYPRNWLMRLEAVSGDSPGHIVCYRAHRLRLENNGSVAPYNSWLPVQDTRPSMLNFATGVSGVAYPAAFLDELRELGRAFEPVCPKADDIWLHFAAVSHDRLVKQIGRRPRKYPEARATQGMALHLSNTGRSANDDQVRATYSQEVLLKLTNASVIS